MMRKAKPFLGGAHKNKKRNNMKELMLTKAQFNIYKVEHYGVEENSLDDLRKASCTNILVLLCKRARDNFNNALFPLAYFSRRQDRELPGAISRGLLGCPCRV